MRGVIPVSGQREAMAGRPGSSPQVFESTPAARNRAERLQVLRSILESLEITEWTPVLSSFAALRRQTGVTRVGWAASMS